MDSKSSSTTTNEAVSYCVTCDAKPGECGHTGPRYLDEIVYERVDGVGWKVPDAEQHRYHNPPKRSRAPQPAPEPVPIQHLVVQLEEHLYLDTTLEDRLRTAYDQDPHRATRLVQSVLTAARSGKILNPAGLLSQQLARF